MSVPFAVLVVVNIIFVIGCIALTSAILLQKKRSAGGMGSVAGMGNVADTYWGKNKDRSAEGTLEKWTKIGAVVLALLSLALCVLY